jgi:hypothetical protein
MKKTSSMAVMACVLASMFAVSTLADEFSSSLRSWGRIRA